MTEEKIQSFHRHILELRKKLSSLDIESPDIKNNSSAKEWQSFMAITLELDRFEQIIIRINNEILSDINHLQEQITAALTDYQQWRDKMREVEKIFMASILRPGYILKQAKRRNKYLEGEYSRIKSAVIANNYETQGELEADIRKVLVHGENAYHADEQNFEDEQIQEKNLWKLAEELETQAIQETDHLDQILQDFKRIVLPAVHPDTSQTSEKTFLTVFESYKTEDYLLMEAYVAEYRGQLEIDDKQDPLIVQEMLSAYQENYHQLIGRLERRLQALKKELTPDELEDTVKVKQHLLEQRDAIRELIVLETEKVFNLREKINGLTQLYIQLNLTDNEK